MKIGKMLSGVVKVVSTPITVTESAVDVLTGGDGSKRSKNNSDLFIGNDIINGICKGLGDIGK